MPTQRHEGLRPTTHVGRTMPMAAGKEIPTIGKVKVARCHKCYTTVPNLASRLQSVTAVPNPAVEIKMVIRTEYS